MLSAMAESVTTTPCQRDGPVPPNVSIPAHDKAAIGCDLNAYCAICVGHNAVELGKLHSPSVNKEPQRPDKSFNERVPLVFHSTEVYDSPAWTM
jgi:hypothetical protein